MEVILSDLALSRGILEAILEHRRPSWSHLGRKRTPCHLAERTPKGPGRGGGGYPSPKGRGVSLEEDRKISLDRRSPRGLAGLFRYPDYESNGLSRFQANGCPCLSRLCYLLLILLFFRRRFAPPPLLSGLGLLLGGVSVLWSPVSLPLPSLCLHARALAAARPGDIARGALHTK